MVTAGRVRYGGVCARSLTSLSGFEEHFWAAAATKWAAVKESKGRGVGAASALGLVERGYTASLLCARAGEP